MFNKFEGIAIETIQNKYDQFQSVLHSRQDKTYFSQAFLVPKL